jgi:hypothetical protein
MRSTAQEDWPLLEELGQGATFAELGAKQNISAGAMRVRVFRLRNLLAQRAA